MTWCCPPSTSCRQVQSGVELAHTTGGSLDRILELVEQTTVAAKEISAATQQQKSATDQVVRAMREVAAVAQQTAAGSRQVASSAESLSGMARESSQVGAAFHIVDEGLAGYVDDAAGGEVVMVEFDRSAFISKFQEEAADLLQRLNEGVIALEADPANRAIIDTMLRDAHTLKGSSRMVGLIEVSDVAHWLEDIMVRVRDAISPIRPRCPTSSSRHSTRSSI